MAKIPLPERGQPLDLSYMYQIANAVNEIATQVTTSASKYASIDTVGSGKQTARTSDTKFVAGYKEVANNASVNAGNERSFFYDFPSDFKYAPIVTATVVNTGGTSAGTNTSVIITSVTTSRVEGVVRFNAQGEVSVAVNLIMMGIPN